MAFNKKVLCLKAAPKITIFLHFITVGISLFSFKSFFKKKSWSK